LIEPLPHITAFEIRHLRLQDGGVRAIANYRIMAERWGVRVTGRRVQRGGSEIDDALPYVDIITVFRSSYLGVGHHVANPN
jgi:hypothetical protein